MNSICLACYALAPRIFYPLIAKTVTCLSCKVTMESNAFIGTTLLDVYEKCRFINGAFHVFEAMPEKCDVTWSSMIAGFMQNDMYKEALRLFLLAQRNGVEMNFFMISYVLCASAALAALIQGKNSNLPSFQLHGGYFLPIYKLFSSLYIPHILIHNIHLKASNPSPSLYLLPSQKV